MGTTGRPENLVVVRRRGAEADRAHEADTSLAGVGDAGESAVGAMRESASFRQNVLVRRAVEPGAEGAAVDFAAVVGSVDAAVEVERAGLEDTSEGFDGVAVSFGAGQTFTEVHAEELERNGASRRKRRCRALVAAAVAVGGSFLGGGGRHEGDRAEHSERSDQGRLDHGKSFLHVSIPFQRACFVTDTAPVT